MFTTQEQTKADPDRERLREEQQVWQTLYQRRFQQLQQCASSVFLDGLKAVQIRADRVPTLEAINRQLTPLTGCRAVEARGFLPASEFFECLAQRAFPTVTRLRRLHELDYTPEPDIFHDIFGHVPMHSNSTFADFLQAFGEVAAKAQTALERLRMTRLFWFTVEFGLIREHAEVKVYGSGLASSHGECAHALSESCLRRRFDLLEVMDQPFRHDEIQPVLFVIDSYAELFDAVSEAALMLQHGILNRDFDRTQEYSVRA